MFLGNFRTRFTGLRRIVLPKKFREELKGDGVILTKGIDGCIWGFSKKEWEAEAKKQLEVPVTDEKGRFLRRYLFASAQATELDYQGRFIIESSLIDFAQIKQEILIVGTGDHFEIWNPKKWEKVISQDVNNLSN